MHIKPRETDTVPTCRRSLSFDAVTSPRHTKRGSVDAFTYTGREDTSPYPSRKPAPNAVVVPSRAAVPGGPRRWLPAPSPESARSHGCTPRASSATSAVRRPSDGLSSPTERPLFAATSGTGTPAAMTWETRERLRFAAFGRPVRVRGGRPGGLNDIGRQRPASAGDDDVERQVRCVPGRVVRLDPNAPAVVSDRHSPRGLRCRRRVPPIVAE